MPESFYEKRRRELGLTSKPAVAAPKEDKKSSSEPSFYERRRMELGLQKDTRPKQTSTRPDLATQKVNLNEQRVSQQPVKPKQPSVVERPKNVTSTTHGFSHPADVDAPTITNRNANVQKAFNEPKKVLPGQIKLPELSYPTNIGPAKSKGVAVAMSETLGGILDTLTAGAAKPLTERIQKYVGSENTATALPKARVDQIKAKHGEEIGQALGYIAPGAAIERGVAKLGTKALANAPKLLKVAATGATAGAIESAAQEGGDVAFRGGKFDPLNVALGTGIGGAANVAAPLIGKGIKKGIDALRKSSGASPNLGFSAGGKGFKEKTKVNKNPERVRDLIDVGGRPEKADTGSWWGKFKTSFVDRNAPMQTATNALGGKNLPTEKNPYKQAWLSSGWKGKADAKLEYGFINESGKKIGKSLQEALAPVKSRLDDWREYAVALRSKEYARDGLESGLSPELADKTIASYSKDKDLIQADKDIKQYMSNMNQSTLVDSGIWSADKLKHLNESQPDYIPMNRTGKSGKASDHQAGARRFGNAKDPTKKRTGGNSPIIDPIESIAKQTYKNQSLAERNNVVRLFAELAEKNKDNSFMVPVKTSSALDKVQATLDDFIMSPSKDMEKQLNDAIDLFKPQTIDGQKNIVTVMRNGKPEQWQILDEQFAKSLSGMNEEGSNIVLNIMGKATGVLKAGLTLAPDFVVKNLIRDQMSAFINSRYGFIPIWDTISGLKSAIKHDDSFYKWMSSGGANGAWVSLERDYLQGEIQKLTKTGIAKIQKNPLEILRKLSEYSEQATRLGEFKRGIKKGASLADAALASRDVTLDFSRAGTIGRQINKPVAFFNVAVQSLDKMARQFKEYPVQTTAKAGLGITLPSVLLYMMNHDNPAYDEIPQWERDTYWHIFVSPNSQPIRIPKPFELGITFGTFFERMMQHYKEDDPKAFQGFAKQMLDGFTPDIIPTLFVPWIEAFSNKKKFSGAPVVPKREEGLLKKDQYGAYTSETSKLLGKKFDQSPRILDNTITGYTGTLGTYALGGVDKLLKMAGKVNPPPRPDGGLATYPVTKSFVSKGLEGSSQSLDDFYKERGDLTSKQLSAKKNEVDFAETSRLKELDATAKEIKKRQDEIRTILDDPDMKPADKREAIKTLNLQVTNLAREAKGLPAIKG